MIYRTLALVVILGCGGHPATPATVETKPDVPHNVGPPPGPPPNVPERAPTTSNPDITALKSVDESDPRSVERAAKAAAALGERPVAEAVPALAELAKQLPTKKLLVAQVAAIRALAKYEAGAPVLVELIERAPPPRPLAGGDRTGEEAYGLHLAVTGASVNAAGELRATSAVPSLVHEMYTTPELFMQTRRALVAIGPTALADLRAVLRDENAGVTQLFAAKKLDVYCVAGGTCTPVSARDFYAAVVIGDFYDAAAVPDLLAALSRPPAPVYFVDDQPSPNTQYNAIYDALRKIGAPEAAGPVRAAWTKNPELAARILAIATYPFVVRGDGGVAELGKIAADNRADDGLRQEAATAFARLAHTAKDIAKLDALAKKYFDAAAKKRKEANAAKGSKQLERAAAAYKSYARLFQTHIARIVVAIRCKDDLACYAATLTLRPDDAAKHLAPYIKDLASWTADEKHGLLEGEVERAMIELGKRGSKATRYTDALLDAAASDNRLIRQSILLALPKIATLPCGSCVTKLDAAIQAGEGKVALGDLNLETSLLRNYFVWAGK